MKRIITALSILAALFFVQSCEVASFVFHGTLPSEIKVKRIDNLFGAKGLVVMNMGAGIQTKAGDAEGQQDRLCIVDNDGKSVLASFQFDETGAGSSSVWKEIRRTLTLVPSSIAQLSDDYLFLQWVSPQYEYVNWREDVLSGKEDIAINSLLGSLGGDYFLRISDGALFRSPVEFSPKLDDPGMTIDQWFQLAADGKTMVFGGQPEGKKEFRYRPMVVTDAGNALISKSLPEDSDVRMTNAFCVTREGRIFDLYINGGNGTWSYDFDLKPLFLDYGESIAKWPDTGIEKAFMPTFVYDYTLYILACGNGDVYLYRIYLDGYKLEKELVTTASVGSEITRYLYDYYSTIERPTETGRMYNYPGGILSINVKTGSITVDDFPEGFPPSLNNYDQDGYAWVMTDNYRMITKYDINNRTSHTVDIKWGNISLDQFIAVSYESVPGLFYVTATTRDANKYSYIIDAETGEVTEGGITSYEGPVIKTYVRLN